jgi:hypothetical protein
LLSIFVSFAFPEEYANDFILRDYLQNQLWNGHVFTNYVEYYATQSPDFIAFVLEKNVLDSVDKFENFLLSKILKAMIEKNVDYPLLCDTLKDLETFKSSCEIMCAPTIVRAPGSPLSVHFKPKPSREHDVREAKNELYTLLRQHIFTIKLHPNNANEFHIEVTPAKGSEITIKDVLQKVGQLLNTINKASLNSKTELATIFGLKLKKNVFDEEGDYSLIVTTCNEQARELCERLKEINPKQTTALSFSK